MTKKQLWPTRHHRGAVLVSMIAVILILGILGVSLISLTRTSQYSHLSANAASRAYYLAEAGLRQAQQIFCAEGWLHGRQRTFQFRGEEEVKVIRIADIFWATATTGVGTAQEARARVPMPLSLCGAGPEEEPTPILIDEFAVFGDVGIALGKNTLIEGNVAITEDDIDIRGDVEGSVLARDVAISGDGSVTGITVSGGVYASGEVVVKSGTVDGDIQAAAGISINSAKSEVKGWLFSNGPVDLSGGAKVLGHVHACGADVTMGGNSTVIGTASNPVEVRTSGNVYLSGSAVVHGTIYAGGAIEMSGSATIDGEAYAGGLINKGSNNTITGEALQFSPTYLEQPICPYLANLEGLELPEPAEFTTGGSDINVPVRAEAAQARFYLPPGTYGSVSSPSNSQKKYTDLFLGAGSADHGFYYLDAFQFQSQTELYLNLAGTYDIRIFLTGNISVGSGFNVLVSTDGTNYLPITDPSVDPQLATRVYWESKGNFDLGSGSNWFGTVYTPSGNLKVGNSSQLFGSFYSGGGHDIIASNVVHVVPNYFSELNEE